MVTDKVGTGSTGTLTKPVVGLHGSLPIHLLLLLLQLERSMARVFKVLTWGAGQAGVGGLDQRDFAGHWFHPHFTPCREIHRPVHPA